MESEINMPQNSASRQIDGSLPLPQIGDQVFSIDGAELGTVEAVVKGALAQGPAIIVIAKGTFLDACRCIAMEQVQSVQEKVVTLHLKARQVEHLPPCTEIS